MDRLMTESQGHSGGVSLLVREKVYSAYNAGQVRNGKYTVTMDWGTACFAHLPAILETAKKKGSTHITEILYLPHFRKEFLKAPQGIQEAILYITEMMQFMGVKETAASIMLEGWAFKLDRSGQWNVAVCSLIRYLSESTYRVAAYLYMRRTLKLAVPKALHLCHFFEHHGKGMWKVSISPGGHTLLHGRGTGFSQYPNFVNWKKQDKEHESILKSCKYRGINQMFGNPGNWKDVVGPDSVYEAAMKLHVPTDDDIKQLSKLLKTPRGKKDEGTNRKPTGVRKRVRPDEASVYIEEGGLELLRSDPVHGGVRRRPEPLLIQGTPPDIINPFERSRRAKVIPRGKKSG